jgi:predicted nuclease of predicted toxin-antitoxin system
MKFLIDAQLPMRIANLLENLGYDVIHTRNLPLKNATPDSEINKLSILEQRIVITKDKDFLDSFLIKQEPYKLLLITTGNISNKQIEQLFLQNITQIIELFLTYDFLEMTRDSLIIH